MAVAGIVHLRVADAPIVYDTLPDLAREHVIGPVARASLFVGRDIWRNQPGLALPDMPRTFLFRDGRRAGFAPIAFRVTYEAMEYAFRKIFTMLNSAFYWLEFNLAQRANSSN